ncbi:MAG: DNA modification methylase [Planctomycetes bacterium]|nr:DNA modification methylase [Planctomycetota bacterium]MCK6478592.1 DNA modification methylase [Planctomycetota bacterium]
MSQAATRKGRKRKAAPAAPSPGPWRSRIVDRGEASPAALVANPRNWRGHPPAQQAALAGLLDQVGWVQDVVVNRRTGHLVDGHLRVELARARGETAIPVVYVDLDEAEEALVLASLDPLAGMATADPAKLEALLAQATVNDAALRAMLDDLAQKSGIGAEAKEGETDPDDIPEPPETPTTRRGDLWILGEHRLLCGDSGSPEDLDRLLDGGPVHLLNTDPPYNVRVEPRSNNAIAAGLSSFQGTMHHQAADLDRHPEKSKPTHKRMRAKDRPLENDFMSDEAFREKLRAWFGNAARVLLPGRGFFIWGGYSNIANYPPALVEAGLYFSQAIIWVKEHPVLTRKDFMGNHEWAFYGWREGAAHYFAPDINNATDVWSVKKVSPQKMVHLTEKPVELATLAMKYCSRPGETVLDLFGGSGSTLIGAEQMGRNARLIEIDPLYTDVIVARWEQFTGKKAERVPAKGAA